MIGLEKFFIYWDGNNDLSGTDVSSTLFELLEAARILENGAAGTFLGLGAGWGIAEIDLANKLKLPDVVLVDRNPPPLQNYSGEYVMSDIFDFLGKTLRKFGFVTVIGCEYFIGGEYWKRLITLLSNVCLSGALVVINLTPFYENNLPVEASFNVVINKGRMLVLQKT